MKRLFKFKYPKLFLLVVITIISYLIFSNPAVQNFLRGLGGGYLSMFIAGFLFSFGFSAPLAVGFFLVARPENIYLAAMLAGLGSLISNMIIFKIIRFSFMDEFKRLEKTAPIKEVHKLFSISLFHKIKIYLLYVFVGIVLATPLPDELGVVMLAGLTKIKLHLFALIGFVLHAVGVLFILLIGRSLG